MHPLNLRADDGETLRVWRHGESGPAIVFLHGWTASHLEWSPFVHALERGHRVYRWDARAHGGPPPTTDTVATAARMARDLDQMIDTLGLAGACFVGHSMGSLTLWQYLRDHGSGKIGRLCFIDQSPRLGTDDDWKLGIFGDFPPERSARITRSFRDDFAEGVLRFTAYGLNAAARAGYEANGRGWQRLRDYLRGLPAEALVACWEDLANVDFRDVIPAIDRPTLVIANDQDYAHPLAYARELAALIPGARLDVITSKTVDPALYTREFTAALARFLSEDGR